MPRFLAAFPRPFVRFADGAAGARRRHGRAGAAVERRCAAGLAAVVVAPVLADRAAECILPDAPAADGRRGPGWFESSWELQSGLEVREGVPGDLGANEWLEAFCVASRPAVALA